MDHDRFDDQERRFSAAAVCGMLLMTAAALIGGPIGLAAGAVSISLFGYAIVTAFRSDDAFTGPPPIAVQPRDSVATSTESQPAITIHAHAPTAVRKWLERVEQRANADVEQNGR